MPSEAPGQTLTGWGRTSPTVARLLRPADQAGVERALTHPPERGLIPRGMGRSYGDAAQNAGGAVLSTAGLDQLGWADQAAGLIRAGGGTSLARIIRAVVPQGWMVPVLPGTSSVSVGGAIAADVHGKNHHRDATFAHHVASLVLAAPTGTRTLSGAGNPELFWATAGGLGLTGVVVEATLALLRVETSQVMVTTERAADLDDLMARMSSGDHRFRYSVAWIDALAGGRSLGRSVLSRGDHARLDELPPAARARPLDLPPPSARTLPPLLPPGLINRASIRAFNEMWFRKAPRARTDLQGLAQFFHPLDGLSDWNRLYGPRGLVQYQFAVPLAQAGVVERALVRLGAARLPASLGVLKAFGPANPGPLSFPLAGWTLALDFPARTPGLATCLDGLDELVAGAGGRVYLAKDSRLRPELLAAMYPQLEAWKATRRQLDPEGVLASDLGRRLGLAGPGIRA